MANASATTLPRDRPGIKTSQLKPPKDVYNHGVPVHASKSVLTLPLNSTEHWFKQAGKGTGYPAQLPEIATQGP